MSKIITIVKTITALVLAYIIYEMYCDISLLKNVQMENDVETDTETTCDFHHPVPSSENEQILSPIQELFEIKETTTKPKRKYKKKEKKIDQVELSQEIITSDME